MVNNRANHVQHEKLSAGLSEPNAGGKPGELAEGDYAYLVESHLMNSDVSTLLMCTAKPM